MKRIAKSKVAAYLHLLQRLAIVTDNETDERALRETLLLARECGLSTYDAAYLELEMRRGVQLATLNRTLIRAARYMQVKTVPKTTFSVHEKPHD